MGGECGQRLLDRRVRASADLTPSIQVLIGKLIRLLLITFAILIALSTVGIDFTALAFFSGAVGVGLGFGLQKIVSNLVSGIILLADKSIKPGDVITVGDSFGWVSSMGARYTSIVTRDGREFLIPNEDFVTQRVINWSFSNDEVRLDVPFGVSYTSDPHQVCELAIEAAKSVARVLVSPAPVCHLKAFGECLTEFHPALLDSRSGGRHHQCERQGAAGAVGYVQTRRDRNPLSGARCAHHADCDRDTRQKVGQNLSGRQGYASRNDRRRPHGPRNGAQPAQGRP